MCQNRHILFLISFISSQGPGIMLDCWFSFSAIIYRQMSRGGSNCSVYGP